MRDPDNDLPSGPPQWNSPRRTWLGKFTSAFRGIAQGVEGQSSFAVHLAVALAVVVAAAVLRLTADRWCLLIICIGGVLVAELFNSALEWTCRAVTDRHDPRIEKALDVASGAVLIAAIAAAITGSVIFVEALIA